ncbi:MAG: glycosyltransferase [Cyclobacteriaceae bacterium]
MAKVLYLSYDGITDPLGQSQILPYLTGLTDYGHEFHLIGFEKKEAMYSQANAVKDTIREKPITWIPLTYHKSPPVLSTLYDVWKMRQTATQIVKENNITIVHCRSYIPMLVGEFLKKKFNVKLIFDMRGFWADERVDGNLWSLTNPVYNKIYSFFKKKEMSFVQQADRIVSLTHAGKHEMVSGRLFSDKKLKINSDKITVIPCATDLELFNPEKVSKQMVASLRSKLKLTSDDKILLYLGSLGTWYLVKEMLQFFRKWRKDHPTYKFLFVTKDSIQLVYQYCKELNIATDAILHTQANRHEVPTYLKLADVGIFFIKPAYSKKASSAVKMGEMMAMGLPFVTNKGVGDQDILIEKHGGGISIDISNTNKITFENYGRETTGIHERSIQHLDTTISITNYATLYSGSDKNDLSS